MADNWNPNGPVIVWENLYCEGWHPRSYPTLAAALSEGGITKNHVLTRRIDIASMLKAEMVEPELSKPASKILTANEITILKLAAACAIAGSPLRWSTALDALGESAWAVLNSLKQNGAMEHPGYNDWRITDKGRDDLLKAVGSNLLCTPVSTTLDTDDSDTVSGHSSKTRESGEGE